MFGVVLPQELWHPWPTYSLVVTMVVRNWNSTTVPPVRSFPDSQITIHLMKLWPCRTSPQSFHTYFLVLQPVPIFNTWCTPDLWSSNTSEVGEIFIWNTRDPLIGHIIQWCQTLPPVVGHHLVQELPRGKKNNRVLSPQLGNNSGGQPLLREIKA